LKGKWFLLLGLIAAALVAGNALPVSAGAEKCITCEEEEEPPIEEVEQTLTITISGIGSVQQGTIGLCESNSPAGNTCEVEFPEGEALTLSAHPGAGLSFLGWSGDCSGTGNCSVTMDEARAVTATFADNTPPAVPTITSPTANQVFEWTAEEAVTVSFNNSGDSSAVSFLCSVDVSFGGVGCSSPWSTGNLAAGQHTVYVWAKDAANNISSPASRSFEVVITPPGGEEEGGGGEEEGGSGGEEGGETPPGGSGGGGSGTGSSGTSTPTITTPTTSSLLPPPKVAALLVKKWKLSGNSTLIRKLVLKGLPAGAKVVATCAGKGCPFKSKKPKVVAGVASLTKFFSGHELAANVLVELKVSAPGMTGQTIDLKTRAGKAPKVTTS
jgi:hypothetical protein